jgi:hypothetical protein
MAAKIVVNGKEYDSVEAMPPDVRQAYEKAISMLGDKTHGILADANQNGVPDVLEKLGNTKINFSTSTRTIVYQGKTYNSPDALPQAAKEKYQQAMAKLGVDADNDGIPDVLEAKAQVSAGETSPVISVKTINATSTPVKMSTTVPVSGNTWIWMVVVALLLALVATLAIMLILK